VYLPPLERIARLLHVSLVESLMTSNPFQAVVTRKVPVAVHITPPKQPTPPKEKK
jgi:hypothetical protein